VFADSPKLTLPLAWPYELSEVDERNGTYVIETADGLYRIPSDRMKPAPFPRDLTSRESPGAKPVRLQEDEATERVIERVISHGRSESGELVVRVRWEGYRSNDDTWERAADMPKNVLVKYERRKNMSRGLLK
jgi:hypothetical protein